MPITGNKSRDLEDKRLADGHWGGWALVVNVSSLILSWGWAINAAGLLFAAAMRSRMHGSKRSLLVPIELYETVTPRRCNA